jgi:predicted AAA+ superfamily ATPase
MIQRAIASSVNERFFKGKVVLLFGPRQSGKTTLVKSILQTRQERSLVLNGDEPDVREMLSGATSTRLKAIAGSAKIIFIDEAQRIQDIGLTLKLFVDELPGIQVIASGSSSFELAGRVSEPLTGRKYEYMLFPLSFAEMVNHHGLIDEERMIEHRLTFGSYPEIVVKQEEEKELLTLLAGSYLYKDLLTLDQLKKPVLLEKILRALALQIGSEVSYHEIGQLVGADNETVEKYVSLLEKAFVVFRVPALSRNVRNEIKKGKKIYFYDTGVRNAVIANFSPLRSRTDVGPLWENYLMSERVKLLRNSGIDAQRYFWRTTQQQEIDYIEDREGKLTAFEFKWNEKSRTRFPKTFTDNYKVERTLTITPKVVEDFCNQF